MSSLQILDRTLKNFEVLSNQISNLIREISSDLDYLERGITWEIRCEHHTSLNKISKEGKYLEERLRKWEFLLERPVDSNYFRGTIFDWLESLKGAINGVEKFKEDVKDVKSKMKDMIAEYEKKKKEKDMENSKRNEIKPLSVEEERVMNEILEFLDLKMKK